MSVILLVVGILVTGAGVLAVGFGIPNNEFSLGNTLIVAGTTALCTGLILIGLSAAVTQLTRIAEALRVRPAPRPAARPAEATPRAEPPVREPRSAVEPRPAADATVDVSASAIERLRSSIPRPDRVVAETEDVPLSPGPAQQAAQGEASTETPARASGSAAVETKEPRLDFLFRSRSARPAQPESFDALWPKRQAREAPSPSRAEEPRPAAPPVEKPVAAAEPAPPVEDRRPAPDAAAAAPSPDEPRSVAILKSGVVDGMAYTLYADGSIEAQLPQGTVRFGSIAELRAHIENNS